MSLLFLFVWMYSKVLLLLVFWAMTLSSSCFVAFMLRVLLFQMEASLWPEILKSLFGCPLTWWKKTACGWCLGWRCLRLFAQLFVWCWWFFCLTSISSSSLSMGYCCLCLLSSGRLLAGFCFWLCLVLSPRCSCCQFMSTSVSQWWCNLILKFPLRSRLPTLSAAAYEVWHGSAQIFNPIFPDSGDAASWWRHCFPSAALRSSCTVRMLHHALLPPLVSWHQFLAAVSEPREILCAKGWCSSQLPTSAPCVISVIL